MDRGGPPKGATKAAKEARGAQPRRAEAPLGSLPRITTPLRSCTVLYTIQDHFILDR